MFEGSVMDAPHELVNALTLAMNAQATKEATPPAAPGTMRFVQV